MALISTTVLFCYGCIAALHSYYADRLEPVRALTKPLLMPLLALSYYLGMGDSLWIYSALLFAWLGDIALLKHGKLFFVLGLVSFLVGHLCMSTHLFSVISVEQSLPALTVVLVAMLSIAIALFNFLRPHLGSLKLPVLLYCFVLAGKGSLALVLAWQMPSQITALVAIGALVFMASDLTLAINRFVAPIKNVHLWVMSSYTLAQGMMVFGLGNIA